MEKIVLASNSPRRKEMFERFNINPIIMGSDIIEKINIGETKEQIAMSLALSKALSIFSKFEDEIIIGADTIVVYNNLILGKPKDEEDAFKMLSMLSGKTHEVITGFALLKAGTNIKIVDFEKTLVKFKHLDADTIYKYINTMEPMDKAGAYGIQGLGAILVEKIDGCYLNVVGLPLSKIDSLFKKHFDINIL